jgi:Rps23 Pro-64 3,4-dihydroxylase Tpa1-like proline 4-hydroxylase
MVRASKSVRTFTIDGMKVVVVDALLPRRDLLTLEKSCAEKTFRKNHWSHDEHKEHKLWTARLDPKSVARTVLFEKSLAVSREHFACEGLWCRWTAVNMLSFGDLTFAHTDEPAVSTAPHTHLTFLYFVNSTWDVHWGAEWIFYDGSMDAAACVGPRPGRLVIFDSRLLHKATAPSKNFSGSRLTLVYKCTTAPRSLVRDDI